MARVIKASISFSLVTLLLLAGCDGDASPPDLSGTPVVRVKFQGEPLAGVQVSLFGPSSQSPLVRAITGNDGNAYFTELPSPEPDRYRIGLESLGDGGWMLDPKVIEPFCEAQVLDPLQQSPVQELSLPKRAVRSLTPRASR